MIEATLNSGPSPQAPTSSSDCSSSRLPVELLAKDVRGGDSETGESGSLTNSLQSNRIEVLSNPFGLHDPLDHERPLSHLTDFTRPHHTHFFDV